MTEKQKMKEKGTKGEFNEELRREPVNLYVHDMKGGVESSLVLLEKVLPNDTVDMLVKIHRQNFIQGFIGRSVDTMATPREIALHRYFIPKGTQAIVKYHITGKVHELGRDHIIDKNEFLIYETSPLGNIMFWEKIPDHEFTCEIGEKWMREGIVR